MVSVVNTEIKTVPYQPEDFQQKLETILSRELSPETINTYAGNALDDLVELTEAMAEVYDQQPTIASSDRAEQEDHAYAYFNLGKLEASLDHVADIAESIHALDAVLSRANQTNGVVVPPIELQNEITAGDGSYEQKNRYDRAKTVLFILQHDFGVDVQDPDRLHLAAGSVQGIMRDSSYYLVDAPELSRSILVCDEEDNATYIFDSAKLQEVGMASSELSGLNKDELKNLIRSIPGVGKRIVYSKNFINHVKNHLGHDIPAFTDTPDTMADEMDKGETAYLQIAEPKPEGFSSTKNLIDRFRVGRNTITRAIEQIGPEFGDVIRARFGSVTTNAYSPDQVEMIRSVLEANGALVGKAPDGFLNVKEMANEIGVAQATLRKALETIHGRLGESTLARYGAQIAPAYSPQQTEVVKEYLNSLGLIADKSPEGYLNVKEMAKEFGLSESTVSVAIKELYSQLGDILRAKYGPNITDSFSPAQIETIREHLEQKGTFIEHRPEGYLSLKGIANRFKTGESTVARAINNISSDLGEVITARFDSRVSNAYSPEQIEKIHSELEHMGIFAEASPEGYLTASGIATEYNINPRSVYHAVASLRSELGDTIKAKFGTKARDAYSPEQQRMIVEKARTLKSSVK